MRNVLPTTTLILPFLLSFFLPHAQLWTPAQDNTYYLKNLDLKPQTFFFDLYSELKFKTDKIPTLYRPDYGLIDKYQQAAGDALGGPHLVKVYAVDYALPSLVARVHVLGQQQGSGSESGQGQIQYTNKSHSMEDSIVQGLKLLSLIEQYRQDMQDIIVEKMSTGSSRFAELELVSLEVTSGLNVFVTEDNTLAVLGFQQSMLNFNTGLLIFSCSLFLLLFTLCLWRFLFKFQVQYNINSQGSTDSTTVQLVVISLHDALIDMFVSQKKRNYLVQIEYIPYEDLEVADDNPIASGSQKVVYQVKWNGNIFALVFSRKQKELQEMQVYRYMRYLHENIVQIRGYSQDPQGRQCVLMEFAKKGSLDDFLRQKRHEWLDRSDNQLILVKLRIVQQICSGLLYLHKQGVIHRDIAARNVLLFDLDPVKVKLTDFGLALITSRPQEGNNQKQTVMNTVRNLPIRWTPPEVIQKGGESRWSQKSDIWSLGILMWEVFSDGKIPFEWMDDHAVMHTLGMYSAGRIPADASLPTNKDIPQQIYELMLQCWRAEASKRPNAGEVLLQLKNLIHNLSIGFTGGTGDSRNCQQRSQELQLVARGHNNNVSNQQRMDQSVLRRIVQDVAQLG